MDSLSEERIKNILDSADVRYSYNLAKELETIRSNPVLATEARARRRSMRQES